MAFCQSCVDTGSSCNYSVQRSSCIDCGKVASSHFYTSSNYICPCCSEANIGEENFSTLGSKLPLGNGILSFFGFGKRKPCVCVYEPPSEGLVTCDGKKEDSDELDNREESPQPPSNELAAEELPNPVKSDKVTKTKRRKRSQSADNKSGKRQRSPSKTRKGGDDKRQISPCDTLDRSGKTSCRSSVRTKTPLVKKFQPPVQTRRPPISPVYSSKRYLQSYEPTVKLENASDLQNEQNENYQNSEPDLEHQEKELTRTSSEGSNRTNPAPDREDETKTTYRMRSASCPPVFAENLSTQETNLHQEPLP